MSVVGGSWTHRMARPLVRPLIGTGVTPNHLTTLRLIVGLASAAALLPGESHWTMWAGWLWLVSAFLDRADGELARLGNMSTPGGHLWDSFVDITVNSVFFMAIGVGQRHSSLGDAAIPLGLLAGTCLFLCSYWAMSLERRINHAKKAYSGAWGFDFDDLLYLMAPLCWLDWLMPVLVGAAIGTVSMAVLTGVRLYRLIVQQRTALS